MKFAVHFPPITKLRHGFGPEEINRLLDLFTSAVILVDTHDQRILMANTKAIELSAYTRNELANMRLKDLFTDYPTKAKREDGNATPDTAQLSLVRRNKSNVEVLAAQEEISADGRWVLFSLEPASLSQQRQADLQRRSQLLEHLVNLTSASQQPDIESGLRLVLETGQALTSASSLAVYQAEGQNLQLKRLTYLGEDLPEELPPQDILYLRTAQYWTPGIRPHAYLHSLSRAAGFANLASVPIGDPHAIIGVLVVADTQIPQGEQIIPLLNILAGTAYNVIQHHAKVANLSTELEDQRQFRRFVAIAQDAVQDSLIALTSDYKVILLNRAAEASLGYSNAEAQGLPVADILIGTDNLMPALRIAQDGIPTINQDQIRLYRRSGEAFLARVSTLPVVDGETVEGMIVMIQDLSEQEIAKSQAEQLQQHALLGTVIAIFAHEVRNPLNSISAGLQLMDYKLPPDDPKRETIALMQADCSRVESLMKNVLTYARSTEFEMEPVDLGLLVGRLLDRMRAKITAANITHHMKADPNTPLVMGNPRALEQVFTNLINNAIEAMEQNGGVLGVKVQPAETTGKRQYATVMVADNGPGIPKEIQENLFKPFFTTKSSGTGLGLAITQRILTAHKGLIQLNSFPGGTVFTVQIPAIQPDEAAT